MHYSTLTVFFKNKSSDKPDKQCHKDMLAVKIMVSSAALIYLKSATKTTL